MWKGITSTSYTEEPSNNVVPTVEKGLSENKNNWVILPK
jgi:hypothetical protein